METFFRKVIGVLGARLGCCPRCMRQSFIFMLAAWGLVLIASLATTGMPLVLVIAAGATGLWLSHLMAFAARATKDPVPSKARRQFMLGFAKSFVLVAAATAVPMRTALAQDRMSQCLTCCATKLKACGSGGNCNTLYQNCVTGCNSQGETPSSWRCW